MKLVSVFCTGTTAFSLLIASPVLAERVQLDIDQLDQLTAGSANARPAPNGGAIVGNGSSATLNSTGEVNISDGAHNDVRALNFVNSSESTVANGVNVFDSRVTDNAQLDGAQFDVTQENLVTQDQRRLASLPSYKRGANTETLTTGTQSSTLNASSSIYDQVTDLERTTVTDAVTTSGGFDRSSAPTLRVDFDGKVTVGAGDPVFDADANYGAEFNVPSASNSAGLVFNGGVDFGVDGGDFTLDTGDLGIIATLNLPELDLNFDAMGCLAVNGSCTIDGTQAQSDETVSDHSTLYTSESSESATSSSSSSTHTIVNAPFRLQDAQAEYIVVDESNIDVSATYLVQLSGNAQSGLRAMNAVNASGSAVANGVNVAAHRTGNLETNGGLPYNLSQTNVINHSR